MARWPHDPPSTAYIPTRRILGEYFVGQFAALVEKSGACALPVQCLVNVQVDDIEPLGERGFDVVFHAVDSEHEQRLSFDKVVLATACRWLMTDKAELPALPFIHQD